MHALRFDQCLTYHPEHPEPSADEGDTLIRVRTAGVCSTDLEICRGYMGFTGILGHEFVGEVLESSNPALPGQRVCGEINITCGRCDMCLTHLPTHCRNRSVLGILRHNGAFAEKVRLPASNLHVVPDSITDDQAVFVEPLAAAFQVLEQIRVDNRTRITVLGDGRLGLLTAQVLHRAGANVALVGKHAEKLALGRAWCAQTVLLTHVNPQRDQDVVVDCTGSAAGFELAMDMVRPRGSIVLKSTVAAGKPLNLAPLVIDEITVIGSRCGPFDRAIHALQTGHIDVVPMIHGRMPLQQGIEALHLAGQPGVLKVLIDVQAPCRCD